MAEQARKIDRSDLTDSGIEVSEQCPPPPPVRRKSSFFDRLFMRKSPTPSPLSNTTSMESLPPLSPLSLSGYNRLTRHRLLDQELADNIRNILPPRMQLYDTWNLVYSMEQHGISLNTLYRNADSNNHMSKPHHIADSGFADKIVTDMVVTSARQDAKAPSGTVLIIKDKHNNKFGAYLNEDLKPMDHKRYYGNGECFLWKCEPVHSSDKSIENHVRFKAFMYTGINDNIIFSNANFIAIGSSNGENGLYIDKLLSSGVSYRCDTFGNEILNSSDPNLKCGKFEIVGLELWRVGDAA